MNMKSARSVDYRKQIVDGFVVESDMHGFMPVEYIAWVNGDRRVWGAGATRQLAINSAVLVAKTFAEQGDSES